MVDAVVFEYLCQVGDGCGANIALQSPSPLESRGPAVAVFAQSREEALSKGHARGARSGMGLPGCLGGEKTCHPRDIRQLFVDTNAPSRLSDTLE